MQKKKLPKSLRHYLSKIKNKPSPQVQFPHTNSLITKNFILSGCKHPKTRSFAVDQAGDGAETTRKDDEAALADIDKFLFENFRSLYLRDEDNDDNINNTSDTISSCSSRNNGRHNHHNRRDDDSDDFRKKGKENGSNNKTENDLSSGVILFDSPRFIDPPTNLRGSARFYIGRRSSSSSLMEEASRSSLTVSEDISSTAVTATTALASNINDLSEDHEKDGFAAADKLPEDSIAILTYSSNPYDDFKSSMQEMVDTRLRSHGSVEWEFMEQILFCYLKLNDKKSYKYVLNAFVDLIVALRCRRPERSLSMHRDGGARVAGGGGRDMSRRKKRRDQT